ncbi:MAG: glutamate-5-semialdehyde dehydrogenase [Candidatus Fibromonas sp.]|jgi:glutamate-5-semialdehyde dehydrogenase|nr:glutamate-5-semialdehyde dehydrogenase [Candidatus Fibromonas sp.]
MEKGSENNLEKTAVDIAQTAKNVSLELRTLSAGVRNDVLKTVAKSIRAQEAAILEENRRDIDAAKTDGLANSMIDRLTLNSKRVEEMARGVEEIALFADPLGKVLENRTLKNGIDISRISVPLGAIFFIYESRPNVTIDGAALCFKSGNAVILRGGKESVHSGSFLAKIFCDALVEFNISRSAIQYIDNPDRNLLGFLLKQNQYLDLVIPRGGEGLIRTVSEHSRIPVIKHFNGICHIYIDKSADLEKAAKILYNAKVQRPSVCNAVETVLFHKDFPKDAMEQILMPLRDAGVEFFFGKRGIEYLDLMLSVCLVNDVKEACEHIEKYGSHHTDAIVAQDAEVLEYFASNVDSASVMLNVSTRLADGGQYGLGAEVGISTDKLHARGPMGMESLCSYKWLLKGNGQVRE